jgi:hypothetical protein
MLTNPETPFHVLLEHYGTRCATLAEESSHSLAQRILKLLAVDLLIESEQRRKTYQHDGRSLLK